MRHDLDPSPDAQPWYRGVSRYEWLVLVIASAGWIFDAYEGQIFNITREQLLAEIAPSAAAEEIRKYGDWFLGIFPTHLRATGSGFCFNGGRVLAAGVLVGSGFLKAIPGIDLRLAIVLLSSVFLLGFVIVIFMPETKDQPLLD